MVTITGFLNVFCCLIFQTEENLSEIGCILLIASKLQSILTPFKLYFIYAHIRPHRSTMACCYIALPHHFAVLLLFSHIHLMFTGELIDLHLAVADCVLPSARRNHPPNLTGCASAWKICAVHHDP